MRMCMYMCMCMWLQPPMHITAGDGDECSDDEYMDGQKRQAEGEPAWAKRDALRLPPVTTAPQSARPGFTVGPGRSLPAHSRAAPERTQSPGVALYPA